MTLAEIGSFIAVFVSLYAIISQRRYTDAKTSAEVAAAEARRAETDSGNAHTAIELREQMKTDRAEYRADNLKLRADLEALTLTLENERTERRSERNTFNAQLEALRGELKERDETIKEQYMWIGLMQAQLIEHSITPRYTGKLLNVTLPTIDEKKETGKP
jgi:hypothetical protein